MKKRNEVPLWKHAGFGALLLLTFVNLFNYLDRYILVALSPAIKRELALTDTQVGLLVTAFMFFYFLISPLFGWLGDRKPRYWVMSAGVAIWSLATVVSGLARGYWTLLFSRFAVGVGEAAYGAISPSVLTDLFPKAIRGRVFSFFFVAIPVGSALGFLLGGMLEKLVGWRMAFLAAGIPGLVLALLLLTQKDPQRGAQDQATEELIPFSVAWKSLFGNLTYVLTILGYCAYTFVVGGVAVWIPHYIERYLGVPASDGSMAFGTITVVGGFLGTFAGGFLADRWARRGTDAYLKLSALSMLVAAPIYIVVLLAPNFWIFCVAVFFLEFLLFLSTGPVNAQIVGCVSPAIRATANAMGIFLIHLLGDAVSPTLVGFISDHSDLKLGMTVFIGGILLSGILWAAKPILFWETLAWPEGALKLPLKQCHRGLHTVAQENTLDAFRAASEAGVEMIELDVRLSGDRIPVVVHDEDIRRISGHDVKVARSSAAELRRLANVPSLREVFEDPALAKMKINVELKLANARGNGAEAVIAAVVKDCHAEGRILFSSFNPLALRRMSMALPEVPRALLATGERDPSNKFYLRWMLLAGISRLHMLNYDGRFLTPKMAAGLKARRVPFAIWTVEDPAQARNFLAMGAESIISPLPGIL